MDDLSAGILMARSAQRRGRAVWIMGAAVMAVGGLTMIALSVASIINGDTVSTTRIRRSDVPNWALGLFALALVPVMWWTWRRESGATMNGEGLVMIKPVQGGMYLTGNYGKSMGVSLPVADNSALRVALVLTRVQNYGLVKLYGLRLTSAHGDVLMDFCLMPKAFDLSPLMAELRRRRITVQLDPALEKQHDHGTAPHSAPPVGPAPSAPGWDPR